MASRRSGTQSPRFGRQRTGLLSVASGRETIFRAIILRSHRVFSQSTAKSFRIAEIQSIPRVAYLAWLVRWLTLSAGDAAPGLKRAGAFPLLCRRSEYSRLTPIEGKMTKI